LEDGDPEGLIAGTLLARQACLEGPHVFMSYSEWFQVTPLFEYVIIKKTYLFINAINGVSYSHKTGNIFYLTVAHPDIWNVQIGLRATITQQFTSKRKQ